MNLSSKGKKMAAILAICFAAYNIILFSLCGFAGHSVVFWISWAFMIVAFAAMATAGVLLGKNGMFLRDWLFGFPIIKHSTFYIIAELIASTVFIILEDYIPFGVAFAVQILFLAVYCVFAISCFLSKETIDEIHEKVSDKTGFIKLLRADSETIAAKCDDPELKKKLQSLSEEIRYSDPMSNDVLFELEKEITFTVSECGKAVDNNDVTAANDLCDKAHLLLVERNKKCKALK